MKYGGKSKLDFELERMTDVLVQGDFVDVQLLERRRLSTNEKTDKSATLRELALPMRVVVAQFERGLLCFYKLVDMLCGRIVL